MQHVQGGDGSLGVAEKTLRGMLSKPQLQQEGMEGFLLLGHLPVLDLGAQEVAYILINYSSPTTTPLHALTAYALVHPSHGGCRD